MTPQPNKKPLLEFMQEFARHAFSHAISEDIKRIQENRQSPEMPPNTKNSIYLPINGVPVEIRRGADGQCLINADDFFRATAQQQSFTEYLSSDAGLDALNEYAAATGESAFKKVLTQIK